MASKRMCTTDELDHKRKLKALEKVKQVKKKSFQLQQASINDEHGVTITDPEQVLNRWQQYGQNIFAKPPNEPSLEQIMYTIQEPSPLMSEFERAITILKKHKSPGMDGTWILKSSMEQLSGGHFVNYLDLEH